MSTDTNKAVGIRSAAENCKIALKSLKFKSMAVSFCTVTAVAAAVVAAGLIGGAAGPDYSAAITHTESDGAAVINYIPPEEYEVRIIADGKNTKIKCSGTVADALRAAHIEVSDDDLINIAPNEKLNDRTRIVINRVDIVEEVQVETIDYATKYREDDSYTVGYTATVVDGEEGEKETTLRHVYIDGELVSSSVVDEDVTEPVDKVVVIGTKEEPKPEPVIEAEKNPAPKASEPVTEEVPLDENGEPISYSKVLTGSSCAYTAPAGAITSTGKTAAVGLVAVNPNVIPYGSKLYIVSADGKRTYGYAVAADTGGAVMRGSIIVDLFMDTESECINWGRRDVNIYFLD